MKIRTEGSNPSPSVMSAHIKSDIDAYLAGKLSESRRQEVDRHTAGCEACRRALTKVRARLAHDRREALKKASGSVPNLLVNRLTQKEASSPRSVWRWGIVLAIAAAALYAWYGGKPHLETAPPTPASKNTEATPPAVPKNDIPVVSSTTVPRRRRVVVQEPGEGLAPPIPLAPTAPDVLVSTSPTF